MARQPATPERRLALDIQWATKEHQQALVLVGHFQKIIAQAEVAGDWRNEMVGDLTWQLRVAEKQELLRRANLERLKTKQAGK